MNEKLSISQIKNQLATMSLDDALQFVTTLENDQRQGVKKIIQSVENTKVKYNRELHRIQKLIDFDKSFNLQYVAGVDEVGRGPLAGPVVAACVIMDLDKPILGVNDSKKLSKNKREQLYDKIVRNSLFCAIGEASNRIIDDINILNATFMAMNASIEHVQQKMGPSGSIPLILVDGNQQIRNQDTPQHTVIQGDSKSYSIACASILAKVYRDRIMEQMDIQYPGYDFANNSGYGTTNHLHSIKTKGLSVIHRKSFCQNIL